MSGDRQHIFDALRSRFNGHGELRRVGRKMAIGTEGGEHKANTTVTLNRTESLDTFGSDIEVWDCVFEFGSKSRLPFDCNTWLEAMVDAFEDAALIWPSFMTAGCNVTAQSGPTRDEEMFIASTTVTLIIQRRVNLPLVRAS